MFVSLYQQNNQTMENLMTKAHELARQLQADNNIKRYHTALSQAMKVIYHNIRLEKEVKTIPDSYKSIMVNSNGFLNIELIDKFYQENKLNQTIAKHLSKFAYKLIPYFGGTQLYFSQTMLNNLK